MRPSSPDIDAAFSARGVVLVGGISDKLALEALPCVLVEISMLKASRSSRSGAQAIGKVLDRLRPGGLGVRLAGLCDAAEERHFQRALERAGFGSNLGRADLEALGFYVCDADLEDELVRSLGAAVVERVIEAEGEWASFQTFQKQPEKRRMTREVQLQDGLFLQPVHAVAEVFLVSILRQQLVQSLDKQADRARAAWHGPRRREDHAPMILAGGCSFVDEWHEVGNILRQQRSLLRLHVQPQLAIRQCS